MVERAYREEEAPEPRRVGQVARGGSAAAALLGGAGAILALLALVSVAPQTMLSLAIMAAGLSVLMIGTSQATKSVYTVEGERMPLAVPMMSSISMAVMGGFGTFLLGLLTLINVASAVLPAVALLVIGSTLLLSSNIGMRVRNVFSRSDRRMARISQAALVLSGLIALGATTLGVLALANLAPGMLTSIGFIGAGVVAFIMGGTLGLAGRRWMTTEEHRTREVA